MLAEVEQTVAAGDSRLRRAAASIRPEIAIGEMENDTGADPTEEFNPLFRFRTKRWAMVDDDLPRLVPVRDPRLRMMTFDALDLLDSRTKRGNPAVPCQRHVSLLRR